MPLNRPDIVELTQAVRQWLDEALRPALEDPVLQYQSRVVANVLGIIERECILGAARSRDEQERLQAFLGQGGDSDLLNKELIEQIQSGELGQRREDLLELLHHISLNKLAIDNPKYSTFKKYQS